MIVRISNEGQYRLDDGLHGRLDELDDAVVKAVEADDEAVSDQLVLPHALLLWAAHCPPRRFAAAA